MHYTVAPNDLALQEGEGAVAAAAECGVGLGDRVETGSRWPRTAVESETAASCVLFLQHTMLAGSVAALVLCLSTNCCPVFLKAGAGVYFVFPPPSVVFKFLFRVVLFSLILEFLFV